MVQSLQRHALTENLKAILTARRYFNRLPDNTILHTRTAVVRLCIPNYVAPDSQARVLSVYRHLHRAASRQMDPLCRYFLRAHVWESFAAHRCTTSQDHIRILLRNADDGLAALQTAAKGTDVKAVNAVFDLVFARFNVEEGPLRRVLRTNRLPLTPAVQVRKLRAPVDISTFEEYTSRSKTSDEFYFQLIRALKSGPSQLSLGYNDTKITFDPRREGTITGEKLPAARERNIISRRMAQVLRIMKRPIDDSAMDYLEYMLASKDLTRAVSGQTEFQIKYPRHNLRFYRRRIMDLLEKAYTVNYSVDGKLVATLPDSTRIKTSTLVI